jgi:hypothetical protein
MNEIRYLERNEIDAVKWDQRIASSNNSLIYAHSWYLDVMTEHWGALILNDYEAIMPLPWRKKFGFYYIYTPPFCNPLGLFCGSGARPEIDQFLKNIPTRFKLWDLNLYIGAMAPGTDFFSVKRQNYLLDLHSDYSILFQHFRHSYKQILNKRDSQNLVVQFNISVEEVISAARKEGKSGLMQWDYQQFQRLYKTLAEQSIAETVGIFSPVKELLASGVFFKLGSRIYYILAGNNPRGRLFSASHHMINTIIKKYAGQNLYLDFEGSDVPGIAFFFEGFGAAPETYYYVHQNRLPWWCSWMKKANKGV